MIEAIRKKINIKNVLLQFLVLLIIFIIFHYFIQNIIYNLSLVGITPGYSFLNEPAGYGIPFSLIPLPSIPTHFDIYLAGLANTLAVSFLGIITATVIGFIIGITQLSKNWLLAKFAKAYVEIFRNIPLLLQIIFWYMGVLSALPSPKNSYSIGSSIFLNLRGLYLPKPLFSSQSSFLIASTIICIAIIISLFIISKQQRIKKGKSFKKSTSILAIIVLFFVLNFFFSRNAITWQIPYLKHLNFVNGITVFPEFVSLWMALSIYTGAFIAEAVRAAINSVDAGQKEAAYSLGLNRTQVLKLIIVPQALRVLIPPLISNYLNLLKNSSLAMAIGFPDLVATLGGTTLMQTGQAIEALSIVMLTYAFFSISISLFLNWYNKKIALKR